MGVIIAERVQSLVESATLKMAQLTRDLKAQGKEVISLSIGEPDFDTPMHIRKAAIEAIEAGNSHYTPVSGTIELREAICEKLKRDNSLHFSPDQIVVSTGAKQSIINVVLSLVNPGEEIILPAPYWVSYAAMAQIAEANVKEVFAGVDQEYKITPAQLENAITEKSRLLVFSNPSNPTGSVYSETELKDLATVLAKYPQLHVISDEIYEFIHFGEKPFSIGRVESIKERVITVNGCSKGYAMTGWRIGYIAATREIAKACDKLQGQYTSGTCSIAQKAAVAALNGTMLPTYEMRDKFKARRDMMISILETIPGMKVSKPEGAFYLFPDVSSFLGKQKDGKTIGNTEDLAMYLLEAAGTAVVTGDAFGAPGCIRISYAASESLLEKAAYRIKEALERLN